VLHVPYTGEAYVCLSCRVQAAECQDPVQAAADACRQCGCRKNGIVADDLLKDPSDEVVHELVGSKRPHKVPGMLSSLKAETDDTDDTVGIHVQGRPSPQMPPLTTDIKRHLCKSCRFPLPPSRHRARGKLENVAVIWLRSKFLIVSRVLPFVFALSFVFVLTSASPF